MHCPYTSVTASMWSEWGSWSDCSETCQGGTRYRRRQCQNGNDCAGTNVVVEYCNTDRPCHGSEFSDIVETIIRQTTEVLQLKQFQVGA